MPYQTPPLPLERPAAPPDPNGSVGPTMTLRQALAASTASCAFRRVEPDDKHLHTDVIIVQCKPPHDWWVYDYRPADGVFTGWQMHDELAMETYLDARLHTPREDGWWPASGLLDVQALYGAPTPDTPQ